MKNPEKPITATQVYDFETGKPNGFYLGLTKREHFAGLAMQGLVHMWSQNTEDQKKCAKRAINMADELLKQLEK